MIFVSVYSSSYSFKMTNVTFNEKEDENFPLNVSKMSSYKFVSYSEESKPSIEWFRRKKLVSNETDESEILHSKPSKIDDEIIYETSNSTKLDDEIDKSDNVNNIELLDDENIESNPEDVKVDEKSSTEQTDENYNITNNKPESMTSILTETISKVIGTNPQINKRGDIMAMKQMKLQMAMNKKQMMLQTITNMMAMKMMKKIKMTKMKYDMKKNKMKYKYSKLFFIIIIIFSYL